MKKLHHWLIPWFLLGEQYFVIEAAYRLFRGERAHVAMLAIWDYAGLPGNLMGQVCVQFGLIWFLIMPFAIWLEDFSRWKLWGGEPYSLGSINKEFIACIKGIH